MRAMQIVLFFAIMLLVSGIVQLVNLENVKKIATPVIEALVARTGLDVIDLTLNIVLNLARKDGGFSTKEEEAELRRNVEIFVKQELSRIQRENGTKSFEPYDLQLEINSLQAVGTDGWKLTLENNKTYSDFGNATHCSSIKNQDKKVKAKSKSEKNKLPEQLSGCIIGWLGFFNTGKTHVVNSVFGRNFATGRTENGVTKGISIAKVGESIYALDTEGAKRTATEEMLQDRLATDQFIQALTIAVSHMLIFQVDVIYSTEVQMLKNIYKRAKEVTSRELKQFVILHNFHDFYYPEEVEYHIKTDIELAFGIKNHTTHSQHPQSGETCYTWSKGGIVHLVMARDGTQAGNKYNPCALKILTEYINTVKTSVTEPVDLLCSMTGEATNLLPRNFYHPKYERKTNIPVVLMPSSNSFSTATEDRFTRLCNTFNPLAWLKKSDVTSWLPTENKVDCNEFFKLSLSDFLVIVNQSNSKIVMKQPTKLEYLPMDEDSETGTSPVVFQPKYNIIDEPQEWGIEMEVVDTSYRVDFNEGFLSVRGCPLVPKYNRVNDNLDHQRTYSVFEVVVQSPEGVNCAEQFKNKQAVPKFQNGVLKILFKMPKTEDEDEEDDSISHHIIDEDGNAIEIEEEEDYDEDGREAVVFSAIEKKSNSLANTAADLW